MKVRVMMTWVESKGQMGYEEMYLERGMVGQFTQDRMAFLPCFVNCMRLRQILISQVLGVLLHKLISISGKKK